MGSPRHRAPRRYRRRNPEQGLLHRILREHLATFLARAESPEARGLPRFVRRELLRYLACGVLAFGFARGCVALGEGSGRPVTRLGRRRQIQPLSVPDELCCDVDGFSMHAKILVEAHERERLEHLCRYVAHPPLSTERLSLAPDGKVIYHLRRHWRDGTAAVAFEPLTFIERLGALVPRPRFHQLTYHGLLAPAAQMRDLVVPRCPAATPGTSPHPSIPRLPWAELLKRVLAIDALTCPWCGGPRRLIALLTDGLVGPQDSGAPQPPHRAAAPRSSSRPARARLRLVSRPTTRRQAPDADGVPGTGLPPRPAARLQPSQAHPRHRPSLPGALRTRPSEHPTRP